MPGRKENDSHPDRYPFCCIVSGVNLLVKCFIEGIHSKWEMFGAEVENLFLPSGLWAWYSDVNFYSVWKNSNDLKGLAP